MTKTQKLLLAAATLSIALWAIPIAHYIILPLDYLNTHFHELAHAIMALATGGIPQEIKVFADGSGVTPVTGGSIFLTASAGYPGTAILGAILILAGRKPESAQRLLKALAIILAASLTLLIRGDIVGIVSAIIWIPTLWFASIKLKGENLQFATQFLGVQMCFTAFQALLTLVTITATSNIPTDAQILQQTTWIPGIVWAVLWSAISLVAVAFSLRRAWAPDTKKSGSRERNPD